MFVSKLSQRNAVSLADTNLGNYWQIFPNPSSDVFTINFTYDKNMNVTVTDIHGKIVPAVAG